MQAKAAAAANTTNQTAAGAAGGEEEEEEEEEELSCGPSDPEAMNKVRTCSFWMEGVALCITGERARSKDFELRKLLTTIKRSFPLGAGIFGLVGNTMRGVTENTPEIGIRRDRPFSGLRVTVAQCSSRSSKVLRNRLWDTKYTVGGKFPPSLHYYYTKDAV